MEAKQKEIDIVYEQRYKNAPRFYHGTSIIELIAMMQDGAKIGDFVQVKDGVITLHKDSGKHSAVCGSSNPSVSLEYAGKGIGGIILSMDKNDLQDHMIRQDYNVRITYNSHTNDKFPTGKNELHAVIRSEYLTEVEWRLPLNTLYPSDVRMEIMFLVYPKSGKSIDREIDVKQYEKLGKIRFIDAQKLRDTGEIVDV